MPILSRPTESLGAFLRSRRAAAEPGGLTGASYRARKVPGLRREELAELAGVSITYYTRLEQGIATNPSSQVLDALARGLRLGHDERAYLYRLAGNAEPVRRLPAHRLRHEVTTLLDRMADVPAIALSPVQDIVAWNRLGHALLAGHLPFDAPEHEHPPNKVAMLFEDPTMRSLHRDWEHEARLAVASLRYLSAAATDATAPSRLVGHLSVASADFAQLWAEQPVQLCTSGTKLFHHPAVGRLDLRYQVLHLPENDGHRLLLMHPEPGSPHDGALRLLASTSITA